MKCATCGYVGHPKCDPVIGLLDVPTDDSGMPLKKYIRHLTREEVWQKIRNTDAHIFCAKCGEHLLTKEQRQLHRAQGGR